jgi:hypothetical protein
MPHKDSAVGLMALLAVSVFWSEAVAETILVPFGPKTQWKYLDDGSDQGTAWRDGAFDDKAWRSGPAPLGYGDPEIATRVSFGQDLQHKFITTYFRHHFEVGAAGDLQQLLFRIRSDDGIVVYLNGKEVIRINLPAGETGSKAPALKALNTLVERLWRHVRVPGKLLGPGKNILAVEVHQVEAASTDLFLDLELRAYGPGEELRPVVAAKARSQTEAFLKEHRIPPEQRLVDGYMDGGREATISAEGLLSGDREVIVVDRTRDELLRKHLEFAGSAPLKALAPLDRAAILAVYVDRVMAHPVNRQWCERATTLLAAEYRGEPVLLGDVPKLCGAGVCRHRSLLYKLLADEAGLRVALVRGGLNMGQTVGHHVWNELYLDDGRRLLVDTMALPELPLPDQRTDAAARYLDVKDRPIYKSQPSEPLQEQIGK